MQKTRDYVLHTGSGSRSLRPPVGGRNDVPHMGRVGPDEEIPLGRVVGSTIDWFERDEHLNLGPKRTGIIRAIRYGITILQSGDEWFQEDSAGIRPMADHQRCTHCGCFVCDSTCPNSNSTHPIQMNPVDFKYLATLSAAKTPLECVEGKITKLFPPKPYASGQRQGELYQNGEITAGGLSIFLKIDSPDHIMDEKKCKGKRVRVEAKEGAKGISGLYYEVGEYEKDGKTIETRQIKLTATAQVTWPDGEPAASQPSGGSEPANRASGASPSSSGATKGSVEGDQSPVSVRVTGWFKIAGVVCEAAGKDFSDFLNGLSSTDIKEITTGISMSYKGQYGVYAPPIFGDGYDPILKEKTADGEPPAAEPKARVPSWQDFMHPKKKKPLGELTDEEFVKMAAWARTTTISDEPKDREAKVFQVNVLAGAASKGMTNKSIFMNSFMAQEGVNETFNLEDLEAVLGEEFSKASKSLSEEEWLEAIKHLTRIVKECKTHHADAIEHGDTSIPD